MSTPTTFNSELVYRVVLDTDEQPQARLAIGPRWEDGRVRFFDTMRQRVLRGEINPSTSDSVCFTQSNGLKMVFEPLTLERYQEVSHEIEGQPAFQSTEEVQSFYLQLAGLEPK